MSIQIEIDEVQTEVAPGTTVLEAARSLGTTIPTLCFDERLEPFGACRVCLVGVDGVCGPVAACTTPCRD
ncbi:MAG: 2Fe-2S iron-sulfur cluster-binding protein, partial [Solirubrobacteraceae bacterium]